MQTFTIPSQVLPFDKPYGWSSFDAIRYIQRMLREQTGEKKFKIGHAGTLDPLATGLLLICIGAATKQAQSLQDAPKEYVAHICFGATTPSYDLETEQVPQLEARPFTLHDLEQVLQTMLGEQMQMPPNFSAKQVDGKRAYTLARQGIQANIKPSQITLYELKLLAFEYPYAEVLIRCSKGTYIRSLAHDIGLKMNTGAYLCGLRRTQNAHFKIEDSVSLAQLASHFNFKTE
ncbi:MAG: tRNA pseudouridine(55) synthase TruB [Bacteroidales bacterium]